MRQSVIVPNTVDVVAPSWRQLKAWPAGTTASHLGEAAGPPVIAPCRGSGCCEYRTALAGPLLAGSAHQ